MVSKPSENNFGVYFGDGNGGFAFQSNHSSGQPQGMGAGDVNGDGAIDVIVSNDANNSIGIFLNTGNGTFSSVATYAVSDGGNQVILEDFNNDGVLDVATKSSDLDVLLGNVVDGVAPLLDFSLRSQVGAKNAISQFSHKLDQLLEQRGEIGAFQSRIQAAAKVLLASSENFKMAESRIRDADVAFESSKLTRLNILQQAASAVLGQANQQPALAIQLLS